MGMGRTLRAKNWGAVPARVTVPPMEQETFESSWVAQDPERFANMTPARLEAHRRAFEEFRRFDAVRDELLSRDDTRGKAVLFKDGQVVSVHDSAHDAVKAGRERFGDGFITPIVEPVRLVYVRR